MASCEPLSPIVLPNSLDEKKPLSVDGLAPSAFERLPDEIIQQILRLTDPDSFASLILLNSKWRCASQQAYLYAHQLSFCHSYATSHPPIPSTSINKANLPSLRRLFAREVKRNLFEAYLRPRKTTVKLISNSISSSSAPGGEGMQFSPSPRGHHLLAYNSSRIYVLNLQGPELAVKRELKILRRPVSTCIVDDGSFLAVLSTDMQVDLYDLGETPPRRKQSLILDNTPRAIALSPCRSVLAAAYEGGIEVSSLSSAALPTDRRAVKCDGVDALAFSSDGTQLLGTSTSSPTPNTVILTAPYYDPGGQMANNDISALWTTSILFPNTSRDCSHAVLLQESSSLEATWSFAYDRSFETFRAVRIEDLRNGTTYFTGPVPTAASPGPILPCTLPAANYQGELVSAGFEGKHIWLYGVPEDLEAPPDVHNPAESFASPGLHRRSSGISARSPIRAQESIGSRVPQWQILCDKLRNTFVGGRMVAESHGVTNVKWVSGFGASSLEERLIIAARGINPHRPITEEDDIDFVDGGRITILDFQYGPNNGQEEEITIEVGTMEPEVLEEELRDMDTEVAIVRRRTVAQRRGNRGGMMPSATTAASRHEDTLLRLPTPDEDLEDPLVPRRMMAARDGLRPAVPSVPDTLDDVSLEDAQEALDAPYTHASPRSGTTLRRAATAAAANRQRNPPPPVAGPVEYRRADGRREHPHESDADNWVPPPPPYAKDDPVVDLPSFLRHASPLGTNQQNSPSDDIPPVPALPPAHATSTMNRPELPRITTSALSSQSRQVSNSTSDSQRMVSSSFGALNLTGEGTEGSVRTDSGNMSERVIYLQTGSEDIYDASPAGTPHPASHPLPTTIPDHRSAGTQSSWIDGTPASTGSLTHSDHADTGFIRSDMHNVNAIRSSNNEYGSQHENQTNQTHVFRLPNASTWPRVTAPLSVPAFSLYGHPHSAPATNMNNEEIIAASLPPARPEQAAWLNTHQNSIGAQGPTPGGFQVPRVPVGSRANGRRVSRPYSTMLPPLRAPSPPEQPLIISTPRGITGAFDVPDPNTTNIPSGPVLHAPVPRHPRPIPGSPLNQPTAQRLETMTSLGTRDQQQPRVSPSMFNIPASSSNFSLRHHASISRRPSRARRGALKNLQDARSRGWTGRKKKAKEQDSQGVGEWTDIVFPKTTSQPPAKDKKCIVM
ncbi:hypothetical protein F5Y16DRAFT_92049 [Xylariaceae sp. FL0255]|nr:hypothetical protein F5Y16DRAFT_92049 [Xylariaceae sp. FL0255]